METKYELEDKEATSDTKLQITTVSERLQFNLNSGSRLPNVAQKWPQSLRNREKPPPLLNMSHKLESRVIKVTLELTIECFGSDSSRKGYPSPRSSSGSVLYSNR